MGYISDWLANLNAQAAEAAEQQRRDDAQQQRKQTIRDERAAVELRRSTRRARAVQKRIELDRYRADSADRQLARWWQQQPEATRLRRYSFIEIQAQLHGLNPGRVVNNPTLSLALRMAGWVRTRQWLDSGSWAGWYPPGAAIPADMRPQPCPPFERPPGRPRTVDAASLPHPDDFT